MNNPLPPLDIFGKSIHVGSVAKIPKMPDWLIHDLPAEDVSNLRKVEGANKTVIEIDKYGYVWFSDNSNMPWFCLKPSEIEIL